MVSGEDFNTLCGVVVGGGDILSPSSVGTTARIGKVVSFIVHPPKNDPKRIRTSVPELNRAWHHSHLEGCSRAHRLALFRLVMRFFKYANVEPKPLRDVSATEAQRFKAAAIQPRPDDPAKTVLSHTTANRCLSAVRQLLRESGHYKKAHSGAFKGMRKQNYHVSPERRRYWIHGPKADLSVQYSDIRALYMACDTMEAKEPTRGFNQDGSPSQISFPAYNAQLARILIQGSWCRMRRESIQNLTYGDVDRLHAMLWTIKGGDPRQHIITEDFYNEVQRLKEITHRPRPKKDYEDRIFLNRYGGPLSERRVLDLWNTARNIAGVDPRIDTTEVRRQSMLVMEELDGSEYTQKGANHANRKTTDLYVERAIDNNPGARDRIAEQVRRYTPRIHDLHLLDKEDRRGDVPGYR